MKLTHFGYWNGRPRDGVELVNETFEGVFKAQNVSFHQSPMCTVQSPIAFQQSSLALLWPSEAPDLQKIHSSSRPIPYFPPLAPIIPIQVLSQLL